jgi:hypothetical protein
LYDIVVATTIVLEKFYVYVLMDLISLAGPPLVYYYGSPYIGAGQPDIIDTTVTTVIVPQVAGALVTAGVLGTMELPSRKAPGAALAAGSAYVFSEDPKRAALAAGSVFLLSKEPDAPKTCLIQ